MPWAIILSSSSSSLSVPSLHFAMIIIIIIIIITIMRRAAKNDQPINSRIKCWINALGDNPLRQSAIKSLKHSFHRTAQENDRDTHARVTIRIFGLFAKCVEAGGYIWDSRAYLLDRVLMSNLSLHQ